MTQGSWESSSESLNGTAAVLCPVGSHGRTVFSEIGPFSERYEQLCPAKAPTDTNKLFPVILPVPPEATTPSHKELSQTSSPFLNSSYRLSAYLIYQPQGELGVSAAERSQSLAGFG